MVTERIPTDGIPTERITNLRNRIASRTPSRQAFIRFSLIIVIITIVAVLAAVYTGRTTVDTAGVVVSGILAVATFSYVLLTYSMASAMQANLEQTKELFKLRRKPDIIRIIENEIDPLLADLWTHRNTFNADGLNAYDSWGHPEKGPMFSTSQSIAS